MKGKQFTARFNSAKFMKKDVYISNMYSGSENSTNFTNARLKLSVRTIFRGHNTKVLTSIHVARFDHFQFPLFHMLFELLQCNTSLFYVFLKIVMLIATTKFSSNRSYLFFCFIHQCPRYWSSFPVERCSWVSFFQIQKVSRIRLLWHAVLVQLK